MPKQYNITPAKGQALLNFQGRRFPDKVDLFEAEVIEEMRNTKAKQQSLLEEETDLNSDFRNLLIQGDCLSACAYLKSKNIKVDLVYIDPPFASGANYAKNIYLRNGGEFNIKTDDNTIGEEIMYGDIWQKEDYLNWLYERLLAIKDVMSETGSIYVHVDWHIGHYVKIILDEIFGENDFKNEIAYGYRIQGINQRCYPRKHDVIFYYARGEEYIFNPEKEITIYEKPFIDTMKKEANLSLLTKKERDEIIKCLEASEPFPDRYKPKLFNTYYSEVFVRDIWDCDYTKPIISGSNEYKEYKTQKSEGLLMRIINASSDRGMIVADFFSGSGTTAKVANDLNRKFIACDIGINAVQTTRDRLVEAGASLDILKIKDGLRLFRNPAQTTAKIFSIIDGFKSRTELNLSDFWDGGIAQGKSLYTPVKFPGIHDKLTKELLDVYLEEIYKLENATSKANEVIIIYAYKDFDIDQEYLNKQLKKAAKTELKVKLVSLDDLLAEKRDALFTPDNADIKITKQGDKYKIEIKKYYSPYLKNKIDEYNAKRVKKDSGKAVKISSNGLELIEAVQFDTTLGKAWKSRLDLEDKAGIKDKIKGVYTLDTDKFRIKIRNIAGDEITIDSEEI